MGLALNGHLGAAITTQVVVVVVFLALEGPQAVAASVAAVLADLKRLMGRQARLTLEEAAAAKRTAALASSSFAIHCEPPPSRHFPHPAHCRI